MAGLRSRVDSQLAQGARNVTTRGRAGYDARRIPRLRPGASWNAVSANVKRMVCTWEKEGAIGGRALRTRKDAIRHAVSLSLREAERSARRRRRGAC